LASAVTPSERAAGQLICLSRRSRPPSQCHPQVARFLLNMTQLDLFQPEAMSFEETREDMPARNLEAKRTSSCVHQTNIPRQEIGMGCAFLARAEPRRVCCRGQLLGNGERSPIGRDPDVHQWAERLRGSALIGRGRRAGGMLPCSNPAKTLVCGASTNSSQHDGSRHPSSERHQTTKTNKCLPAWYKLCSITDHKPLHHSR
jgi:hypothetical protein